MSARSDRGTIRSGYVEGVERTVCLSRLENAAGFEPAAVDELRVRGGDSGGLNTLLTLTGRSAGTLGRGTSARLGHNSKPLTQQACALMPMSFHAGAALAAG